MNLVNNSLLCGDTVFFCFYLLVLIFVYLLISAHYCVLPHCTDFTDMDLTACFLVFANIIIILFYYYCCIICYHVMVK